MDRWSAREDARLRSLVAAGACLTAAAGELGRTHSAVKQRARRLAAASGRFWTEAQLAFLREHYGRMTARQIAGRVNHSASSVHQKALKLGLAKNRRRWDPALEGELRRLNAGGDSDSEIARKLGFERHCIHRQRKRLGLLDQSYGKQSRAAIGAGVRRQLVRLGLERLTDLRIEAWRQLARERGWPVTINGRAVNRRHVQVLDVLWERGPQTRVQLAEAIGMKVHADQKKVLASNGEGGSYLAELMRAGLVISLGRVVRTGGQGKNVHLYALDPSIEKGAEHGQRDQA